MAGDLNFYLVTDLHHWPRDLGTDGRAYERLYNKEQKGLAETGAIIDAYFDKILADTDTKNVLVAGDVSYNGAMESHLDLIPRLQRLKDGGKKVYLITATHDYNPKPEKCGGDEKLVATPTEREQLFDLYFDFGLSDALSVHRESHSYSVKLQDGYRLLCLNDDGDRTFCGYSETQLKWIEEQLDEAKAAGDYIFAMTHHPTLPPSPIYPLFSKRDMLGDWEKTADFLADNGVKFIFTGHTHMQNIAERVSKNGNKLYDINTCSLVGYPTAMRKVKMTDSFVDIQSESIDDFDWDRNGKSVDGYLLDHFQFFLNDIFNAAAYDIDRLADDLAPGFSRTPEQIYKMKLPIQFLGKRLQTMTLGGLGKLLFIGKYVDASIKDVKLKDFVLSLIRNMFKGDEPYTPDTPEYKMTEAIVNKIKKLLRLKKNSEEIVKLLDTAMMSLYDLPPADWSGRFDR